MNSVVPPPERRTQAQRKHETTSALASAALELIGEHGMSGFTVGSVGAKAGISSGLLLYHFGSKAGLINHLIDRAIDNRRGLVASVKSTGIEGICEMLDSLPERINRNAAEARGHSVLLIECGLSSDPEIRQRVAEYNRTMRELFSTFFRQEMEKPGIAQDINPERMASTYLAAIRGTTLQWIIEGDEFDLEGTLQTLKDLLKRKFETAARAAE